MEHKAKQGDIIFKFPEMTLRDWFAGQALESRVCPHNGYEFDAIAVWCGRMADAMLKERSNT